MYEFSQWLRDTPLVELSIWLSATGPSRAIQGFFWAIPILQTIHILAIAAAFGSVFMINMSILGLAGRDRTMTQVSRRFLPWVWGALAVLALTGAGMVIGEPIRELINPAFWIKMGLVVLAVLVSVGFQASVSRSGAAWEARRVAVRAGAVGVLMLWCAIAVFGRWIAYAPV